MSTRHPVRGVAQIAGSTRTPNDINAREGGGVSLLVSPSSSSGLVTTCHHFPSILFFAPLTFLNFTPFFYLFFPSFWLPLGLPFGAFGSPKLGQIRPKLPLDTSLFRKHEFSKKRAPPRAGARFWGSEGPKIGSRWPQDRFKTILKSVFF